MKEVSPDPAVLKGGMFYKLIGRAFPGWFKYNSVSLYQPMYTKLQNITNAELHGKSILFSHDEPKRPIVPKIIRDHELISAILQNHDMKNPAYVDMSSVPDGRVKDFLNCIKVVIQRIENHDLDSVFEGKISSAAVQRSLFDYFSKLAVAIEKRERCASVRTKDNRKTWVLDITREYVFTSPLMLLLTQVHNSILIFDRI